MPSAEQEEAYLGELMLEFPVENAPSVSEALYRVQERYRMVWSRLLNLKTLTLVHTQMDQRLDLVESVVNDAEGLIRDIHRFLFTGVLCNAGEYRSAHDAHAGAVWFGGHDRYYRKIGRFEGSAPENIASDVRAALDAYCMGTSDPLRAVCTFYQRFVRIHPFYDANGRIARLAAALFLRVHGLEVRWNEMESKNNEFIRRLNYVHKHENNPSFYLGILTSYVGKFTHTVEPTSDAVD